MVDVDATGVFLVNGIRPFYSLFHHACFAWILYKKHISTRIWSAHHPNAGRNIQDQKWESTVMYYYYIFALKFAFSFKFEELACIV